MVAPTRLLLVAMVSVAIAAAGFVATKPPEKAPQAETVAAAPTSTPTKTQSAKPTHKPKPKPAFKKADIYVEVFNNSGIKGLAGSTSSRAQGAGWKVVGSDNWYGTIPATTVYYPERLKAAAKALARDLNIERIRPAIAPMRFDRLTVILTSDYR